MYTRQRVVGAQWLRMVAMIICCITAVPLSWGVEEAGNSTCNFEVLGSQMAAEAAHPASPAVAAPTPQQEEEEVGSTIQEMESVHTLSIPSNVSEI